MNCASLAFPIAIIRLSPRSAVKAAPRTPVLLQAGLRTESPERIAD